MKKHPRIGHDILSASGAPIFALAAEIALCHHERWDGNGYPQGLAGMDIPLSARVVAVADVFDALTMKRPYKEAWSMERALETIQAWRGSHFEPAMVDAFMRIVPEIAAAKAHWDAREEAANASNAATAPGAAG